MPPPPPEEYTSQEEEKYKENYKTYIKDARVGTIDATGEKIINIYAVGDDYLIYETEDTNPSLEVKVCVIPRDIKNTKHIPRYYAVQPKYTTAKSLLHKVENPASIRTRIAGILGHALAADENVEKSLESFDDLISEINKEFNLRIYNKLSFLFTNIVLSTIFASLTIWRYWTVSHPPFIYHRYNLDIFTLLMCVLTSASIGGTFSLSIKLRNLTTSRSVSWITYLFYGLERLFISMIAGLILFWAVSANLIFAGMIKEPNTLQGLSTLFLLSTIAGFSETLVPDLLVTLEKKKQKEDAS